ncbi:MULTISPECIES: AAA family ATPase [Rhizobium]|uniref:AAA family ATPase n=1 Tax=Rhizobium TaxID=379 RepID=UPI0010303FC8|nr:MULTISPECIES: AAA family ATPase [Rhizobium]TAZ29818.1 AAA family ATPase [Rhizobium leguminosarum]TBC57147.1 AAA family ATPase [Rhizobium ruizarguesonis]
MADLDRAELKKLYEGEFASYRDEDWAKEWRRNYSEHVRRVQDADWEEWRTPAFQEMLWDSTAVATIGPGQSVTVRGAYEDEELAKLLFDARGSLAEVPVEERGQRLQTLYDGVLLRVYPEHSKRRPRARLTRLLSAMFPDDMTSIADANRIWRVQRRLSATRVRGDFIAQHPTVRSTLRDGVGNPETLEQKVDQAIFAWFLWQKYFGKPDEGAVVTQAAQREASAVPPFSILPANAQRRSLTCVKGNIELLMAMVREAEHGISRQDLVTVILTEATQLNAASAGNILSQAMGGLGLLRVDGSDIYRPTERGLELLTVDDTSTVLRGPLIGRVFGMGHLLLMVRREPGVMKPTDAAKRLQSLVPTWKSTQPGSHICTWARLVGLIDVQSPGGVLVLTDDGEDYAAALPEDFETQWCFHSADETLSGSMEFAEDRPTAPSAAIKRYEIDTIVDEGCFLPPDEIRAAVELLRRKKNIILQGPPGTGKTWLAKRLGYALIGARDPERLTAVQFQPTLSYEDFVRGWRPDGTKGLQLVDGVFLDAVAAAAQEPQTPYVLVIEEINRGNPAQIFGEMLTLIEDSKRNEDEALRLAYPRTIDERCYVPENLYIVGTMNLADRSLALVDLALRRRFAFVTLSPQFNEAWRKWLLDRGAPVNLVSLIADKMQSLNSAIEGDRALGRQFRIGHSFMTPHAKPGNGEEAWRSWYLETVRAELAPLLEEYWFDNEEAAKAQIGRLEAL